MGRAFCNRPWASLGSIVNEIDVLDGFVQNHEAWDHMFVLVVYSLFFFFLGESVYSVLNLYQIIVPSLYSKSIIQD